MKFQRFFRTIKTRIKFRKYIMNTLSKIFTVENLVSILRFKLSKAQFFRFNGEKLKYFYHSYNNHRLTERAIEIPIIRFYLERTGIRNCLEIGNVTNHYYSYFQELFDSRVVVDKYEKGLGVINKDIKDFVPKNKFDFIFSISTFEHMDSDRGRNTEYIKGQSRYITYAADNIFHVCKNLLNPEGIFIITAPLGYTHEWDLTLFSNDFLNKKILNIKSIEIKFLRKINEIEWKETNIKDAKKAKFNYPLRGVNVISIVEIRK